MNATDVPSAGTLQNIDWLTADPPRAEIAFGATSALVGISPEQREQIRFIADLYDDIVQVVVRKDSDIESLEDLLGKRVYIGKNGSGTQTMAREVLLSMGIEVTDQMRHGTEEDGLSLRRLARDTLAQEELCDSFDMRRRLLPLMRRRRVKLRFRSSV